MGVSRTDLDCDRNVSAVVVEAVADARGVAPTELEPLHGVVDADALDDLLDARSNDAGATTTVSFTYAGCEVTITGHSEVVVRPDDDADAGQPN
jgi:hypothetical protein